MQDTVQVPIPEKCGFVLIQSPNEGELSIGLGGTFLDLTEEEEDRVKEIFGRLIGIAYLLYKDEDAIHDAYKEAMQDDVFMAGITDSLSTEAVPEWWSNTEGSA